MKNAFFLLGFFILAPFILILALTFTFTLSYTSSKAVLGASDGFTVKGPVAYAALPSTSNEGFSIEFGTGDARTEIVRQFLEKHESPLEPYAKHIIDTAEKYGLDYRLIPAIAMQESNLCKKVRDDSPNNCWGYGIYGGKGRAFDNLEQGIDVVSEALSRKYKKNNGLITPAEIESMYNPSSTGSWAFSVNFFMDQMK